MYEFTCDKSNDFDNKKGKRSIIQIRYAFWLIYNQYQLWLKLHLILEYCYILLLLLISVCTTRLLPVIHQCISEDVYLWSLFSVFFHNHCLSNARFQMVNHQCVKSSSSSLVTHLCLSITRLLVVTNHSVSSFMFPHVIHLCVSSTS